jgi:hypothetical protein
VAFLFIITKREVSQMRWLSRLLVVLIVCFVAMALPAAPAQANGGGASITLSPSSGVPGTTKVTVYGYNFTADKWADIYYDGNLQEEVKTDDDGDFRVTFEVPESYTGDHTVLAEDTEVKSASMDFKVKPGLTVSPEEGSVGTMVTVEGHGFAEEEEDIELMYYFNSEYEVIEDDIPANEDGWWKRIFQIPSSHQGDHEIDAEGDESQDYEVEDATFEVIPWINILDEPSGSIVDEPLGSPGESITMTGNGFYADDSYIKILFAGEEAETEPEIIRADENGYWEASFKVPEMPIDTYSITAKGELTKDVNELSFEIGPGLVLSPEEGHVGTNLTVAGHGFATNEDVAIMYDGSQIETATTNSSGSFTTIFPVPESQHGEREVTAEDAAGNNATAIFTMESDPPPTPTLSSPSDGDRVGVIGRERPTFNWSAVLDDSGVYYSLQIARGKNVTATGFADPVVSVQNIVGTNYTLNKTEALPYGTYYWIVQAVDGAGNAGNWTVAYSFRAGALPLWAFILIIVAVVVGVGAAVYFFVIRRRIYYY